MLRFVAFYLGVVAICATIFLAVSRPPAEPEPLDYEAIGFCFWERYDPAELVSETTRDVRFCIEVYPYSQR